MLSIEWRLETGRGRTKVEVTAGKMGQGIIAHFFNPCAHIGAVAVSEFDHKENRASTSVITLLGHKDDGIAYQAAHELCRDKKVPVCVVAGIHLDDITKAEIKQIGRNASIATQKLLKLISLGN